MKREHNQYKKSPSILTLFVILVLGVSLFSSLVLAQDISLSYIDPDTEQTLSTYTLNQTTSIEVPDTTLSLHITSGNVHHLVPNVSLSNNTNITLSVRELSNTKYQNLAYQRMPSHNVWRYTIKKIVYVDMIDLNEFETPLKHTFEREGTTFNNTDKIKTMYHTVETPALVNGTFDYTAIDFENRDVVKNEVTSDKVTFKTNDFGIFILAEDKARPEICGNGIDEDFDGKDTACPSTGGSSSSSRSSRSSSSSSDGRTGGIDPVVPGNYTITRDPCKNRRIDGNETDIDCGGPQCPACEIDKNCIQDSDCQSNYCDTRLNLCKSPTCSDNVKNGNETDVDCGGDCEPCDRHEQCETDSDCSTGYCSPSVGQCLTKPKSTTDKEDEPTQEKPAPVQPKPPVQEQSTSKPESTFPWVIILSFIAGSALIGAIVYQVQQKGVHIKGMHHTYEKPASTLTTDEQPSLEKERRVQTTSSNRPTNGNELQDYIRKEREKGFKQDVITTKLLRAGWSQEDIDSAFKTETQENDTSSKSLDQSRLQALTRYIQKNKEQNIPLKTIRSTLEKSDWPIAYINQAMRSYSSNEKTTNNIPTNVKKDTNSQSSAESEKQQTSEKKKTHAKNQDITLSFAENLILEEEALGTDPTVLYNTFLKKRWPRYMIDQAFSNVQKKCDQTKRRLGSKKFNQALLFCLVSLNKKQTLSTVVQALQRNGYPKETQEVLCREIHALQDELVRYDLDKPRIAKKKAHHIIETLKETYSEQILSAALRMLGWKKRAIDAILHKKQKSYK